MLKLIYFVPEKKSFGALFDAGFKLKGDRGYVIFRTHLAVHYAI